jgi:hypothetical protein
VWETALPDPRVPSPKFQAKLRVSPSGSLDPEPLKVTVSGASPAVGVAEIEATGARFSPAITCTSSNQVSENSPDAHLRHDSRKMVIAEPLALVSISSWCQISLAESNSNHSTELEVWSVPPARSIPSSAM